MYFKYLTKLHREKKRCTIFRKFGLAALVGALIAILGGILAKYNHKFKSYIKPINMKLYHATIGMIIFLLAMIAVSLATYSNYFHNRMKNTPWVGRLCLWAPIILAGKQKLEFFFKKWIHIFKISSYI